MPKLNQFVFAFCGHNMSGNLSTDIFLDADGLWKDDVTTVTFGAKPLFSWFFFKTCHMLKGKELSSTISPLHLRNGYTSSSVHNNSNDKFS